MLCRVIRTMFSKKTIESLAPLENIFFCVNRGLQVSERVCGPSHFLITLATLASFMEGLMKCGVGVSRLCVRNLAGCWHSVDGAIWRQMYGSRFRTVGEQIARCCSTITGNCVQLVAARLFNHLEALPEGINMGVISTEQSVRLI